MNEIQQGSQISNDSKVSWLSIFPIIFAIAVVPLITYLKIIPLEGALSDVWIGHQNNIDFFSYYKAVFFIITTAMGLVILLWKQYFTEEIQIKKTKYYIPMVIYSFSVIVSTLLAKHREVALKGAPDRYEGMYVLLAYMVILFVTINLVNNKKQIKAVLGALGISATILGIVGIFQFLGYDLFQTDFGKKLILPTEYEHLSQDLKFTFEWFNAVYITLFNPNYVGSYMGMIAPILIALFIVVEKKSYKIICILMSILTLINLIGSRSRGGYIGILFSIVAITIIFSKQIFKKGKYLAVAIISLLIIFNVVNTVANNEIYSRFSTILTQQKLSDDIMKELHSDKNNLTIIMERNLLSISANEGQLMFSDDSGNALEFDYNNESNKITLNDERYINYIFSIEPYVQDHILTIENRGSNLYFLVQENEFKIFNLKGEAIDLEYIPRYGFEGKELMGSSRGYIWSRSIPLLKKTSLVGFGPDTFVLHFPQHDYIGKLYALRDKTTIVDKPHNLYLQIAINTGVISLLSLLSIFIFYIVSSVKLYINREIKSFYEMIGISIFPSILSYLATGIFNDSVVGVAPVFWILLGLGISINYKLNNESKV